MDSEKNDIETKQLEVLVIGAGISGIVAAKCMQDAGFNVEVFERSGDVGGLWTFKPKAYGVMSFTHMYVNLIVLPVFDNMQNHFTLIKKCRFLALLGT